MSVSDVDYMQQIIDETFSDIFEDPREYDFDLVDEPPPWAVEDDGGGHCLPSA
jgi:hypothetical protein